MDADKYVLVVNLPPLRVIDGNLNQGRTENIQGAWDPYRLVTVVPAVDVQRKEALSDIGMNSRRAVIHLEYDFE